MANKRKFKRDYIILESKDMNFRYKERVLPKAFAKIEINEEKATVALYVENIKCVEEGYSVVIIQSDYDTLELGNIQVEENGKGEHTFNLDDNSDVDIKAIAILYGKIVPLIGFKGNKIDNYEEIIFAGQEEIQEYEYEELEYEYIEVEEDEDGEAEEEIVEEEAIKEIQTEKDYSNTTTLEIEDDEELEYEYIEIDEDEDEEYEEMNNIEEYQQYIKTKSDPGMYMDLGSKKYEYLCDKKPEPTRNHKKQSKKQEKEKETKSPNMLLMPRQIKKGLKMFKEVKPFIEDYIDNTRWWKIEISPMTMCGYTMPHLGYINTLNYTMYSDTVMQSYKYRHYLFGVQYDEYNRRQNYIYAIPGKKEEQPDKGHTGFIRYQPCDQRNDNLGYWFCLIDARSRKILK